MWGNDALQFQIRKNRFQKKIIKLLIIRIRLVKNYLK